MRRRPRAWATLLVFGALVACERTSHRPALPAATQVPADEGTASPPRERPVEATPSAELDGSGGAPEPIDMGEPTPRSDLPAGWPEQVPYPADLTFERLSAEESSEVYIEGRHPAPPEELLDWFVTYMSDAGCLVLERDRLGGSSRVRLARDYERWLLVVGLQRDQDDETFTWVNVRRQRNEVPIHSLPGQAGAWDCTASLPVTPQRPALTCRLHQGPRVEDIPAGVTELDAALGQGDMAVVARTDRQLWLLSIRDGTVVGGPVLVTDLTLLESSDAAPQVVAGSDGGWLVSWVDGEPPERIACHYDERLRRTDRLLRMSRDLGLRQPTGWAPTAIHDRTEYAAAWTERTAADGLVLRVAGVKRDGDRIRRSGRVAVRGAGPRIGPALVYDGRRTLGLLWGSDDGVMLRTVGTDGLPDEPQRQIDAGPPTWVGAAFGDDSFWVAWATRERGFWRRAALDGCTDNAHGSLDGRPGHLFATDWGPIAQVREGDAIRLVRLSDDGGDAPDVTPEVVGSSHLRLDWIDLEATADGLRGLGHGEAGYAEVWWACE